MGSSALVVHVADARFDVPLIVDLYGGIAVAVALEVVEPPLGLLIACMPAAKTVLSSRAPQALRWIGQLLQGGATPRGGEVKER